MRGNIVWFAVLAAVVVGGGCAPKEWSFADDGAFDPFEKINRAVYAFNRKADGILLAPIARGYDYVPQPVRTGADNFFANLAQPRNFANSVMQFDSGGTIISAGRFVVNTIGGIGGVFDVATPLGIPPGEENDFGKTLRHYGFNNTPYLVLPLLGPSSFADAPGSVVDSFADPAHYLPRPGQIGLTAWSVVHLRHSFLALDEVAADAVDEYIFVRDIYEERRRGGAILEGEDGDDEYAAASPTTITAKQQ